MCASQTSASRSSRYVTAGPTWSESAVLPHPGRDMGVGQKKYGTGD